MSNGIFNQHEMIDKSIQLADGISVSGAKNVLFLSELIQVLVALKKGLADDEKAKNETIECLKSQLKHVTEKPQVNEEGDEVVGGQHYDFHFGGVKDGDN